MKYTLLFLLAFTMLGLSSCEEKAPEQSPEAVEETQPDYSVAPVNAFVDPIAAAHAVGKFRSMGMAEFDLVLTFGGRERFRGKVSLSSSTGLLRLDHADGKSVVWDGEKAYMTPSDAEIGGARFDIFTWTYFFALPYKLDDPGTIWTETPYHEIDDKTYDSQKLSFADGTGDSSLDWYIVYADPSTQLIHAAAYIVTMSATQEEAEEDPHAIVYGDYKDIDGIPVAHSWTFWGWTKSDNLTKQLGSAVVSNVRFGDLDASKFQAPENSVEVVYEPEGH